MSQTCLDLPTPLPPTQGKKSAGWGLPVLLAALMFASGAFAQGDEVPKSNTYSGPRDEVSWVSGGVGDDARDEMRKAAVDYNVLMVFSEARGHYLADVPFRITRRSGDTIYAGTSEGPLLYLKLPPGTYKIAADLNGAWQSKRVLITPSARVHRLSFVAPLQTSR